MAKKRKCKSQNVLSVVLLILILATLAFIWGNSLESPAESQEKSRLVFTFVEPLLELIVGEGNATEFLIRKLAHFGEFGVLGCELALLLVLRKRQNLQWFVNIAAFSFVAAALDETIQLFAARGSTLADVWLDFAGALTGICGTLAIHAAVMYFTRRRKYKQSLRQLRESPDGAEPAKDGAAS